MPPRRTSGVNIDRRRGPCVASPCVATDMTAVLYAVYGRLFYSCYTLRRDAPRGRRREYEHRRRCVRLSGCGAVAEGALAARDAQRANGRRVRRDAARPLSDGWDPMGHDGRDDRDGGAARAL